MATTTEQVEQTDRQETGDDDITPPTEVQEPRDQQHLLFLAMDLARLEENLRILFVQMGRQELHRRPAALTAPPGGGACPVCTAIWRNNKLARAPLKSSGVPTGTQCEAA